MRHCPIGLTFHALLLMSGYFSLEAQAYSSLSGRRTSSLPVTGTTSSESNQLRQRSRPIANTSSREPKPLEALQNPSDGEDISKEDRNRGILVLLTVPLAWGTFEPVVRYVYAIEPPIPGLVFSPCYYFVAASALSLLSWATSSSSDETDINAKGSQDEYTELSETEKSVTEKIPAGNNLPILGGMELGFYLFLGNSLQVLGLKTLNSDRVAFLIQLTTIFVPLVQGIAARNLLAIPIRTWIACLIALSGVGVLALEGNPDVVEQQAMTQQFFLSQGDFLVVGSALAYTFHCIRLEKYAKTTRAVTLASCKATTETILSVLLVLALLSYGGDTTEAASTSSNFLANFAAESGTEITSFFSTMSEKISEGSIPASALIPAVGAVLWTGLVTCGYTIYAQSYGQSRVKPSDANLIYTFQPVWTSLIAFFLLGETLGPSGFAGGALIGLAVFLVITGEQ